MSATEPKRRQRRPPSIEVRRTRLRNAEARRPKDCEPFFAEIARATRDLDFAVRMYAVELEEQLFTDEQIRKLQVEALKGALKSLGDIGGIHDRR